MGWNYSLLVKHLPSMFKSPPQTSTKKMHHVFAHTCWHSFSVEGPSSQMTGFCPVGIKLVSQHSNSAKLSYSPNYSASTLTQLCLHALLHPFLTNIELVGFMLVGMSQNLFLKIVLTFFLYQFLNTSLIIEKVLKYDIFMKNLVN